MEQIIDGVARFQSQVYPRQRSLYQRLASEGQQPKAMVISCSDSRVVPEIITQSDPGEMFVCRNAGNIVPPFGDHIGGVTSAIEYAVVGLEVEHIIVCGHTDCGAMKALLHPESLAEMPSVAAWLSHCKCAHGVFRHVHDGKVSDKDAVRVMAMENVVAQLTHLRTHPSVASRVATGELTLHGWLFDIESGTIWAMDGMTGEFSRVEDDETLPVALPGARRAVISGRNMIAAE
jgi:carbonic anhydrase